MKTIRVIHWVFLALTLCFLLAIPLLGMGSAAIHWNGTCYGFTDGQWACPWWEFAQNEMFWAGFLFFPLTIMTLGMWGVLTLIRWGMRLYWRTKSMRAGKGDGI